MDPGRFEGPDKPGRRERAIKMKKGIENAPGARNGYIPIFRVFI
jgi:hypothetical protein